MLLFIRRGGQRPVERVGLNQRSLHLRFFLLIVSVVFACFAPAVYADDCLQRIARGDPYWASDCVNTPSITLGGLTTIAAALAAAGLAGKGPFKDLSKTGIRQTLDKELDKIGVLRPSTEDTSRRHITHVKCVKCGRMIDRRNLIPVRETGAPYVPGKSIVGDAVHVISRILTDAYQTVVGPPDVEAFCPYCEQRQVIPPPKYKPFDVREPYASGGMPG